MGIVGILANPGSGKDIRRIISHASLFSNQDKSNIVERIISVVGKLGEHDLYIMPDMDHIGSSAVYRIANEKNTAKERLHILEMSIENNLNDTIEFIDQMKKLGANVLVVLGGDGTSRAAAKALGTTPLIAISTGTNNVFPEMVEGTVVGMAAAALASGLVNSEECCESCKRIEIYRDGQLADIALIDLVVSSQTFIGAKALWNMEDISRVVATQCHPATIGFSALIGCNAIVEHADDFGIVADFSMDTPNRKAAIAAGMMIPVHIKNQSILPLKQKLVMKMDKPGILALDGEREIPFEEGDEFTILITRQGPRKVNLKRTLELAHTAGLYKY